MLNPSHIPKTMSTRWHMMVLYPEGKKATCQISHMWRPHLQSEFFCLIPAKWRPLGPKVAWPDPRISGAASADSAAVASATGTAERTAAAAKAALQRLEDGFLLKPKLQLFELPIFSSKIQAAMALVAFVGGLVSLFQIWLRNIAYSCVFDKRTLYTCLCITIDYLRIDYTMRCRAGSRYITCLFMQSERFQFTNASNGRADPHKAQKEQSFKRYHISKAIGSTIPNFTFSITRQLQHRWPSPFTAPKRHSPAPKRQSWRGAELVETCWNYHLWLVKKGRFW